MLSPKLFLHASSELKTFCMDREYMKPVETVPFNEILCFKNVDKLQSVSLQHSNPSWIHLYFHNLKVFVIVNSYYMLLLLHHSHQLKANQLQDLLRLYKWFSFSLFPP